VFVLTVIARRAAEFSEVLGVLSRSGA